jgi:tetratricopeptide (TPR) repeat protein
MAFATRGDQFLALGDHRKALEDYRSAEGLVQRLPRQTAGLTQPRDLFSLQLACGQMHKELDEVDEAKLWIERAEKNLQQQLTLNPGDEAVKSKLERLAELRSQVSSDAP